jgi:hypothetical protein
MKKFTITLLIFFPIFLFGQIIHIPDDYATIQEGIDAAGENDTVLVAAGTYTENLWFQNKRIVLASHYLTTMDSNYIHSTIVDGGGTNSVLFCEQLPVGTHICGLTLRNGNADAQNGGGLVLLGSLARVSHMVIHSNMAAFGAGVFIGDGAPVFEHVRIMDNVASQDGGGVMARNSSPQFIDCTISGNFAEDGGAMMYRADQPEMIIFEPRFERCIVKNNEAIAQTGGLYFRRNDGSEANMDISIKESIISGNTGTNSGGIQIRGGEVTYHIENSKIISNTVQGFNAGLAITNGCSGEIINCVFAHNEAALNGGYWNGGGCTLWGSEANIYNCNFVGNQAPYGSGLVVGPNSEAYVFNCIFRDNQNQQAIVIDFNDFGGVLHIDYTNIQYGMDSVRVDPLSQLDWGEHNVDADPLFVGSGEDEYALSEGSPCIDAGTPDTSGMNIPYYDLLHNYRLWDGDGNGSEIIDMGAYEYDAPVWVGIFEPDTHNEQLSLILNIYPNPASNMVQIVCSGEISSPATIRLYSSNGICVKAIKDMNIASKNTFTLDLKGLSPGIYFIQVQNGMYSETAKILLKR